MPIMMLRRDTWVVRSVPILPIDLPEDQDLIGVISHSI
jgi:hypothetical protein